ncbi:MAG: acyl-CoA thioesterase [Flavobacteriales bacterium]|nr:acyl-CoA thioesterase [Flavobacteriales bacterium]
MHTTPIQVRFADCDSFKHVNNAVYLTYAEQARIQFFDKVLGESIDWKSKGLILARAEANYLRPILLHDKIEVDTVCSKIGSKSIILSYTIWKLENGSRIEMCNGETVLVGFNYVANESMLIPEDWREKLND